MDRFEDLWGQPRSLATENQHVIGPIGNLVVAARAAGGQCKQPRRVRLAELHKRRPVGMDLDRRIFVVVETSPPQLSIIKTKPQGLNQMKPRAGVGA